MPNLVSVCSTLLVWARLHEGSIFLKSIGPTGITISSVALSPGFKNELRF